MGRQAASNEAMRRLEADHSDDPCRVAGAHAYREEFDAAVRWLDRADAQKDFHIATSKGDPAFAKLAGDPRYRAWRRYMNLPP
jgi:hypothetical protein